MPKYRVTFHESGTLFVSSKYASDIILDEYHDLDASTPENMIVEYTVAPEHSGYFESLLEGSDGVKVWAKSDELLALVRRFVAKKASFRELKDAIK